MKENFDGGGIPSGFKSCHPGAACYRTPAMTMQTLRPESGFAGSPVSEDAGIGNLYDWEGWE